MFRVVDCFKAIHWKNVFLLTCIESEIMETLWKSLMFFQGAEGILVISVWNAKCNNFLLLFLFFYYN